MILCDAGPLVALLHRNDRHHEVCKATFRSLGEPLLTVWPVFTEAMYLLGFSWQAQDRLWDFLERGALSLGQLGGEDAPRLRQLMHQYKGLPMDLADAGLVCVAEKESIHRVFTLDRRDFSVYQPRGLGAFQLLPESL